MAKDKSKYYKSDEDEVTFNLVDEHTVLKLQRDGDISLPKRKINVPKDEQWNTKIMASRLLQGIQNGDSLIKIEKSLIDIIGTNKASLERNARTMTTGAECEGRIDSYKELESRGVVQKKVWISTPDDRVRESHLDIDGEEVDIDELFSNGLMYPADPSGEPSEVWNCRCSIRTRIVGFMKSDGSISYVKQNNTETLHDKQIEAIKEERKEEEEKTTHENIILGVDINKKNTENFSDEFKEELPTLADRISKRDYPEFSELYDLYGKAQTSEDKLLCKFLQDSSSYIQTYKDFSEEKNKQYAEIFSVLQTPSETKLFRGESGEWAKHYGDFTIGKEIEFKSISFTTPMDKEELSALNNYDVLFEFKEGTPSICTANQAWDDVLVLGNFKVVDSKILENGQKYVVLEYIK